MSNFSYSKIAFLVLALPRLIVGMSDWDEPGDIRTDDMSGQSGRVIQKEEICHDGKSVYRKKRLALIPLPGEKVPCPLSFKKCIPPLTPKEYAKRTCNAYCSDSGLRELYTHLKRGVLVRALIHGETGIGKSYLAYAFSQESGHPYIISDLSTIRLLTPWHNCMYEGMKELLNQAIQCSRESAKKVVAIFDYIEVMDEPSGFEYNGEPDPLGSLALHEFFDRQDHGDVAARNVSIIALTDEPERLSAQFLARFFLSIKINLPNTLMRYAIILNCIDAMKNDIDESVIQHSHELAEKTSSLTPRQIEDIFRAASQMRFRGIDTNDILAHKIEPKSNITWNLILKAFYERR